MSLSGLKVGIGKADFMYKFYRLVRKYELLQTYAT